MKLRIICVVLLCLLIFFACTHGLSPEEKKQVEILQTELEGVRKDIAASQIELSKYNGGLIHSLILARIEIIKTTEALIQQRIHAIESKTPVSIQILANKQDAERAEKLAAEVSQQEEKLRESVIEASKNRGGLVQAIALSTVATQAQTLAMLRQQYLVSSLGLFTPTYKADITPTIPIDKEVKSPPAIVDMPSNNKKIEDDIISVSLDRKEFKKQDYQDYIFFNLHVSAPGLDKPARAIKGAINFNDLFGERKFGILWTINTPINPGETIVEKGTGFKFNQFIDSHQWVRNTQLSDIKTTFTVSSILYQDGTRRDFE